MKKKHLKKLGKCSFIERKFYFPVKIKATSYSKRQGTSFD